MRLLTTISAFALASVAASSIALAADLPARTAPVKPSPVFAPAFSWTGGYVGAFAGYGFGGEDRLGIRRDTPAPASLTNFGDLDSDGFFGGVRAGYNYQIGQFVVGAEADIALSDIGDRAGSTQLIPGFGTTALVGRSDVTFFGTIRARAGFAFDRALVYATGGLAYAGTEYRIAGVGPLGTTAGFKKDETQIGFAVGGGVEYAFTNNLTANLEYQFIGLDKQRYGFNYLNAAGAVIGTGSTVATQSFHTVRAGVNYKF